MLRFILCPLLAAVVVLAGPSAQPTRILRKPLAEYGATKSEGPEQAIIRADLSPDGKLVACCRRGGKVTVYAVGNARPLFTAQTGAERTSPFSGGAAFSPDGKLVAFPGKGKRIEIRSARTGERHASAELPGAGPEAVDALAFSPDGRKLAVSSGVLYHKDLHVFDTATGRLLGQPLRNVDGMACQLLFSADCRRLVANHYFTVYVVDAAAHRLLAKVPAKAPAVFFQGGKLLAAEGESLAVHEVTDQGLGKEALGRFAEKLRPAGANRTAVAGQPPVAAIPIKDEVSVRDMQGRERFRVTGDGSRVRRVSLSADGRALLVCRESLRAQVFRLE